MHNYGHCNWWNTYCYDYHSDDHLSETIAAGVVIMSFEIAGWSMFYTGYKDALKYGKYLIEFCAKPSEQNVQPKRTCDTAVRVQKVYLYLGAGAS